MALDTNGTIAGRGGNQMRSDKLMKAKAKSKKNGKMAIKIKGSPQAVRSTLASFTPVSGNMESGS